MSQDLREVEGYEGRYSVSADGAVFSHLSCKYLRPGLTSAGYRTVALRKDGASQSAYVHVLVARAFIPNPDNKPTVNHKRGVDRGDAVGNLEWATYGENHAHAYRELGRVAWSKGRVRGQSPNAKPVRASDGRTFSCVADAADAVGVVPGAVARAARTGRRSAGLLWVFV